MHDHLQSEQETGINISVFYESLAVSSALAAALLLFTAKQIAAEEFLDVVEAISGKAFINMQKIPEKFRDIIYNSAIEYVERVVVNLPKTGA